MKITLLGTGTPLPHPKRAGTGILIETRDQPLLVDCGPGSIYNLLDLDTALPDIEHLLFTHHHIDHNGSFYNFVIMGWMLGRDRLTVVGPEGSENLIDSLYEIYEEDIKYKENVTDASLESIRDIEFKLITEDFQLSTQEYEITALEVDHPIETYAYKVVATETGDTVVFSGDTAFFPPLVDFAAGADILIHDAMITPIIDPIPREEILSEYEGRYPLDETDWEVFSETHSSPEQAATVAADADVDKLVLTHIMQLRDKEYMLKEARSKFDGDIIIAEDGISVKI